MSLEVDFDYDDVLNEESNIGHTMNSTSATTGEAVPIYDRTVASSAQQYHTRDNNNFNTTTNGDDEEYQEQKDGNDIEEGQSDEGKLFVGGLNWDTTEETLKEYFSAFGKVNQVKLMKDFVTGKSRGFAFIHFEESSSIDDIEKQDHYLDGRKIDPKRAVPRKEYQAQLASANQNNYHNRYNQQTASDKIFLGGIHFDATEEELAEFCSNKFGPVKDAIILMDKQTGRPRGFAFVTFEKTEDAEKALETGNGVEFKGRTLEVKPATPKNKQQQQQQQFHKNKSYNQYNNNNKNNNMYGGYDTNNNNMMYGNMMMNMYGMMGYMNPTMMQQMYYGGNVGVDNNGNYQHKEDKSGKKKTSSRESATEGPEAGNTMETNKTSRESQQNDQGDSSNMNNNFYGNSMNSYTNYAAQSYNPMMMNQYYPNMYGQMAGYSQQQNGYGYYKNYQNNNNKNYNHNNNNRNYDKGGRDFKSGSSKFSHDRKKHHPYSR